MLCGWEGNHRSGVALAIHHRLQWFIHPWAHGLKREMSTPPTILMGYGTLYLPQCKVCVYFTSIFQSVSHTLNDKWTASQLNACIRYTQTHTHTQVQTDGHVENIMANHKLLQYSQYRLHHCCHLPNKVQNIDHMSGISVDFSALMLLVGRQEELSASKNWVMRCWCGYLSAARCRLFAYGPARKRPLNGCTSSSMSSISYTL